MAILPGSKEKPVWLDETRSFCEDNGIKIAGWGPDLLTVEAKSPELADKITSQLSQLGFSAMAHDGDAEAGLLDLSRNSEAVQNKIRNFDISRRLWSEQIEPALWAVCSAVLLASAFSRSTRYPPQLCILLGVVLALLFAWDALRIWTWRLDLLPEGLRIRRYNRWATIPWNQIRAIDSRPTKFGRNQQSVILTLRSRSPEQLGTFMDAFALNLRDRIRYELAQRRHESS
jgi:hypothetical protein